MRKYVIILLLLSAFNNGHAQVEKPGKDSILKCSAPLFVFLSPVSQTICVNSSVKFSAIAFAPTYKNWQVSIDGGTIWNDIDGATEDTLVISNASFQMNNYKYRCYYSDDCKSVYTNVATLTIANIPTTIIQNPENIHTCVESNVEFKVDATGSSLAYQWQVSNGNSNLYTDITNYSGAILKLMNVNSNINNTKYRCIINSECFETQITEPVTLTVNPVNTIITEQPTTQYVCAGNNAFFQTNATGENISYQWQTSSADNNYIFLDIPEATFATLNMPFDLSNNNKQFRCKILSSCATIYTDSKYLVYTTDAPAIFKQPTIQKAACKLGDTATIFIESFSSSYQWQVSNDNGNHFSDIPEATNYSYDIIYNSPDFFNTFYRCKVSGNCFSRYSDSIKISANFSEPVLITSQPLDTSVFAGTPANFIITTSGAAQYYTWQISRDSGKTFNYFYSLGNSPSLTLYGPSYFMNNAMFRCEITDWCGNTIYSTDATLKITALWKGEFSTDWNNPGNWSSGEIPLASSDIYIPDGCHFYPEVNSEVICKSLKVSAGAGLTINTNANIIITGK